jgi:hypothetical protein
MASSDDGRKSPWSSWLAPGDVRRAENPSPQQSLDSDAKRQVSRERHEQSSQLEQHGNDRSATSTDTFSPLIAFKRFVDDQFAAITEFPSNVTELKRHSRELDAAYETQRQAQSRWTGSGGYHYADFQHMSRMCEPEGPGEAENLARMLILEAELKNQDVPTGKVIALFEDRDFNPKHVIEANSPWPFYYSASSKEAQEGYLPSDALSHLTPASSTHWLSVNWFKHSPYSPVNLEADTMLSQYDTKWRNSFEDLLEASLDKPMTSRDRKGGRPFGETISAWRAPGLDWMLSLQCRGILPPQLPSMYSQYRISRDYSTPSSQRKFSFQESGRADVNELVYEVGATTMPYRVKIATSKDQYRRAMNEAELEPEERICPRHADNQSSEDYAYETSLAERYYRDQMSGSSEANPSPNRCPDELGRAVGQAAREASETELTELDLYQQQLELLEEQNAMNLWERRRDEEAARQQSLVDEYRQQLKLLEEQNSRRRAMVATGYEDIEIDQAARQQAARAFADEENGLGEDFGFEGQPLRTLRDSGAMAWYNGPRSEDFIAWARKRVDDMQKQNDDFEDEQYALWNRVDELAENQRALVERLDAREREQKSRTFEQEDHVADRSLPLPLAADSNRPQVLSTLTTTHTTRLPDGSVKTTVVLKRRFADGGEETQESTQTSFDESAGAGNVVGQEPAKERKSWFWS